MTEEEIQRIERELDIRLPRAYREAMVPFSVPSCAGNDDTELWDNAGKLIQLNKELRVGDQFVEPWPRHMFALGRDAGGAASALDLSKEPPVLWWADRCHLDAVGSGPSTESFPAWAKQYLADLQDDLRDAGVDPDSTPNHRQQVQADNAKSGCRDFVVLVMIGVAVVLVVIVAAVLYGLISAWMRA